MLNRCPHSLFLWNLATGLPVLLLHVFAGHGVESFRIESCGTDVEGVLVDELEGPVDKPGTTIRT